MTQDDGTAPANGHSDEWVPFGDQPYNVMPRSEVEPLLRLLHAREPQVFARLRVALMTGDHYTVTRRRADK